MRILWVESADVRCEVLYWRDAQLANDTRVSKPQAGALRCSQVGVNYDPMIAKLIARGPDRATALASLHAGLSELQVGSQEPIPRTVYGLGFDWVCMGVGPWVCEGFSQCACLPGSCCSTDLCFALALPHSYLNMT